MKKVIDTEYRKYSLSSVEADVHWLHKLLVDEKFKPDIIVGVCRGGWIPARLLCDKFAHFEAVQDDKGDWGVHVRYPHLFNVGMRRYAVLKGGSDIVWYQKLEGTARDEVKGKRVLIVDDVIDGGASILAVAKDIASAEPGEMGVAALDIKETPYVVLDDSMSEEEKETRIQEEVTARKNVMDELEQITSGKIFIKNTVQGDNVWILYPWENQEVRLEIYRRYGKEAFEKTLPVESLTSSMMSEALYTELPNFEDCNKKIKEKKDKG